MSQDPATALIRLPGHRTYGVPVPASQPARVEWEFALLSALAYPPHDRERTPDEPAPAIFPSISKAVFNVVGLSRRNRGAPAIAGSLEILWMQNTFPVRIPASLAAEAGKLIPAFIKVIHGAVRTSRPDHLRHAIRKLPEPGLALHQLRADAFAFGDVAGDLRSTDDGAFQILHR